MSVMSENSVKTVRKPSSVHGPALVQANLSESAKEEWKKVFPHQVLQSYTSSVTFMKQLAVVAVSTITYLREIFPEESYVTETLGGVPLKILKAKCEDETAHFVSTSLINSFAAIEKKYLAKLVMCFYDGPYHVDNLVEALFLEFTYLPTGVSMDMRSAGRDSGATQTVKYAFEDIRENSSSQLKGAIQSPKQVFEDIRKNTLNLLKACHLLPQPPRRENQEPYDICMRLYYNQDAPVGYQAPGFSPVSAEEAAEPRDPLAGALAVASTLGFVETPFHHLVARSHIREPASSREATASPNVGTITQNASFDGDVCSGQLLLTTDESAALRCACESRAATGKDEPLITCEYCGTAQHALCYGVGRAGAAALARHCCTRCSDLDPARARTCPALAGLPRDQRELLCLLRRSLAWVAREQRVTARSLAARFLLSDRVTRKLLKHLHTTGVLKGNRDELDSPQIVDREQLRIVSSKYMRPDENSLVERLVAESLSQEGTLDPVGNVLGSKEQHTLQQATTMGKIIQHTPPDNDVEDSTLKQYRHAILLFTDKNTDDELPLSGSHNPVKNIVMKEKTVTKRIMDDPDKKNLKSRLRTKRSKLHMQ